MESGMEWPAQNENSHIMIYYTWEFSRRSQSVELKERRDILFYFIQGKKKYIDVMGVRSVAYNIIENNIKM